MDKRDVKAEAVEQLLDLKPVDASNPHAARLGAAFLKKAPGRLPDFEKVRQKVIARRDAAEADRRRFRRVWVPAAVAAVALIAVGVILVRPYLNEPAPVVQAMVTPQGKAQGFRIENSLELHVRSASGLTSTQKGNAVTLKADAVSALFDFEPNDRLRSVQIITPRATFSVIGTRFIIQSEKDFCFLAVESGAVRVSAAGKEYVVRGGEFWAERKDVQQTGKTETNGKKLFPAFVTAQDTGALVTGITAKTESPVLPRSERRVTLTLRSGSVVSGVLVSQNAEGVEMRAAAAGNQVLRFKREEIAGIEYLK